MWSGREIFLVAETGFWNQLYKALIDEGGLPNMSDIDIFNMMKRWVQEFDEYTGVPGMGWYVFLIGSD